MKRVHLKALTIGGRFNTMQFWCFDGEAILCAKGARRLFGVRFEDGAHVQVEASERPLKNSVRVKVNNEHDAWVNGKAVRYAAEHETAVAWGLVNLMRMHGALGRTLHVRMRRARVPA